MGRSEFAIQMIFRSALQREFRATAAGMFVALFAILVSVVLIRMLGDAVSGKVPADAVFALIGFGALAQLPIVLTLTLCATVLLTLSRCYRDSEMVVWFASGLSLTGFVRPVLTFALPAVAVIGVFTLMVTPWAHQQSEEFQTQLESRDDTTRVTPGVFRESSDQRRVFFAETGAGEGGKLRNVFVHSVEDGEISVIASAEGSMYVDERGDRFVVLEDGRRYDGVPGTPEYRVIDFERYEVLVEQKRAVARSQRTRATVSTELASGRMPNQLGELSSRINIPLGAMMLTLLAIPLAYVNPRAGRGSNFIIALLAYLIYSNAVSLCDAWVSQERIGFWTAVLIPHLIALSLFGMMIHRRISLTGLFRRARA